MRATVSDLGLTRKAIHEARQLRNTEGADPSVTFRTLNAKLRRGWEPKPNPSRGFSQIPKYSA
jgi:hypothetical protein